MKNIKSRNQFLVEKSNYNLITEAGIQGNNSKWSETMLGKLFSWTFRVITLDGFLTDKFKDLVGAKSFIIKNIAKRLEKAIDKLPGEYVDRNGDINYSNLEMQYYDEIYNTINLMLKSKDTPIGKIYNSLNASLTSLESISSELDPKNNEQLSLKNDIDAKIDIIKPINNKVSNIVEELSEEELASKIGYDFSKSIDKLGEKTKIKRKLDSIKSTLINSIADSKESGKVSTESTYEIISLLNKARNVYMEEDREGETIYRGNKRETIFNPNRRLFSLWEEKVLKILSRKSSIIPKNILSYINSSLASVDPMKYNVEVSPGVHKNVLDQLSDIDKAIAKADAKFSSNAKVTANDVIPHGKSTAKSFHLKRHEKIKITKESLLRSFLKIEASEGNLFLLDKTKLDTDKEDMSNKSVIFIPTGTYINGMVLGVLSLSPNIFDNIPTSSGARVKIKDLELDSIDYIRNDSDYFWAVCNQKIIESGKGVMFKIFNPGIGLTKDRLRDSDVDGLVENIVFNKVDDIKALYGNDDKIVEIEKKFISAKFNFNSSSYRIIDNYFNANKF